MSTEERKILHKLLDMMIDQGETGMQYQYYLPGEDFTMIRKTICLYMQASEKKEDNRHEYW